MCLDYITGRFNDWKEKGPHRELWGWKILEKHDYGLQGEYYTTDGKSLSEGLVEGEVIPTPLELDKWYSSTDVDLHCVDFNEKTPENAYRSGFHFYYRKKDAEEGAIPDLRYIFVKVIVRKLTAVGRQWNCKIGVAQEMKIVKVYNND